MAVPYTFAGATSSIPLSQLDANFATTFTLGNTAIQLGNTVTTLNNMTLANVTISSGNVTITNVSVTTANVTTGNVTTLTSTNATLTNMSSGNVTITGGTINGTTLGATTAASANVTTLTTSSTVTLNGGTANGVAYLNGSKVLTTGSALTFDGTTLTTTTTSGIPLVVTGTGSVGARIVGGSGAGAGSYLSLQAQGGNAALIGTEASIVGSGTSANLMLYGYGSNNIIMAPATAEVARFTSTGLGIGTSSPSTKLTVRGVTFTDNGATGGASGLVYGISASSGGNFGQIGNTGTRWSLGYGPSLTALGTEVLVWNDSGSVGIGTSSPVTKLNIASAAGSPTSVSVGAIRVYETTNNYGLNIGGDGTYGYIQGLRGATSTLGFNDLVLQPNGGNLGLGVTPSAWQSGRTAFQFGAIAFLRGDSAVSEIGANAFFNGTNWIYTTTAAASRLTQSAGAFSWHTAPSGTAGNPISFSQVMTLDASGNLGIGTSSPAYKLDVVGAVQSSAGYYINGNTSGGYVWVRDNYALRFGTNDTERARITSGGKWLVNTTSTAFPGIELVRQTVAADEAISVWNDTTTGDSGFIAFYTDNGAGRGSITYNRAGGLVAYNTTSDYRSKDIIGPAQNTGAVIDALKIYEGVMKGATQPRPMMIAHEAQEVVPFCVSGVKDETNEDGTPKYQQMDHASLVPLLIAEIQSLRARVAALEAA